MSPRQTIALKAAGSLILLAALAWVMDLGTLPERMSALSPEGLALAAVAVVAAVAVSVLKWGVILARRGHPLSALRLTRHYLVGLFFNNILPGTVGGDAVRAWSTTRDTGEVPETVGSVITERLIAGAGLGLTAAIGLLFLPDPARFALSVAAFLGINLGLIGLLLLPRLADGAIRALLPAGWAAGTSDTLRAIRAGLSDLRILGPVLALSVVFQCLVAAVNAALFSALGVPVGFGACLIFTPMIFALTMLPLSLSGFGLREAAYAYFFALVGVPMADAVAVSLVFFGLVAVISLPGAPLFLLSDRPQGIRSRALKPEARP